MTWVLLLWEGRGMLSCCDSAVVTEWRLFGLGVVVLGVSDGVQ